MSHSHTHAPGESHSHSHAPPQQQNPPVPDPALQARIEQDFKPVDLKLTDDNTKALCGPHELEKCSDCNIDFINLNRLSKLLANNPTLLCPPPANIVSQHLSKAITTTKEEGNALYKLNRHAEAISRYTMASSIAVQRPPWESNAFMREELSTVISNRSAAYLESGDYIGALVDADLVIALKRNWSKGHFRKAKALLGLEQWEEAKDAVRLGLQFEPSNKELNDFLADIERNERKAEMKKAKSVPLEKPGDLLPTPIHA